MTLFDGNTIDSRNRFASYFPGGLLARGEMCDRAATLAEEFAELGIPAIDISDTELLATTPIDMQQPEQVTKPFLAGAKVINLFKEEQ